MKPVNKSFHKRLLNVGYEYLKTHLPYPIKGAAILSEYKHTTTKRRVTITASENYWTKRNGIKAFGSSEKEFFWFYHSKNKRSKFKRKLKNGKVRLIVLD